MNSLKTMKILDMIDREEQEAFTTSVIAKPTMPVSQLFSGTPQVELWQQSDSLQSAEKHDKSREWRRLIYLDKY